MRLKDPGAQPGKFQRPRAVRPLFERGTMVTGDAAQSLWWDSDGNLFDDEDLTKFSGLVIVRPGWVTTMSKSVDLVQAIRTSLPESHEWDEPPKRRCSTSPSAWPSWASCP